MTVFAFGWACIGMGCMAYSVAALQRATKIYRGATEMYRLSGEAWRMAREEREEAIRLLDEWEKLK